MLTRRRARKVAAAIGALPNFEITHLAEVAYSHIGALLADCVLQAGLRYETVVAPRVRRIIRLFPEASTVSGTVSVTSVVGSKHFLNWRHSLKPERFERLVDALGAEGIDTAQDLRVWLDRADNRMKLLQLDGVGPKTVDYMGGLVGLQTVAIDRHLMRFLNDLGVTSKDYEIYRDFYVMVSEVLGVSIRDLDHAIWRYCSDASEAAKRKQR